MEGRGECGDDIGDVKFVWVTACAELSALKEYGHVSVVGEGGAVCGPRFAAGQNVGFVDQNDIAAAFGVVAVDG